MTDYQALISEYDLNIMLGTVTEAALDELKFMGKDPKDLLIALKSCEPDVVQRMKDLALIVSLVQMRGTSLAKIQDRTGEKGKRQLMALVQKYKIAPHLKATPMKVPTLPRIASLFPQMAMEFRKKHPGYVQPLGTKGIIPEFLMFPGGGALITPDSMVLWLQWYESFCKIVGIPFEESTASIGNRFSTILARIDLAEI
jgi:hypothetical protein